VAADERLNMLDKLRQLLDGEKWKLERNGVVFKNDAAVVRVSATGLFTPPVSFTLNDTQLSLLRNFINEFHPVANDYDVYLVKLDGGVRLAVENEFEQLMLDLYEDGTATAFVGWGSSDYWDRWKVSSDGSIQYTGTVDGYRRMPEWVELAVEVQRAR
jgi:hypothetical protein